MSNKPMPFQLAVAPGDAPLVAEALAVQACTEIMCGRRRAAARLDALRARLQDSLPHAAKPFDTGDWSVICAVIEAGGRPEIAIVPPSWDRWSGKGAIEIRIGGATWRSTGFEHDDRSPVLAEIRACLDALSPMSG